MIVDESQSGDACAPAPKTHIVAAVAGRPTPIEQVYFSEFFLKDGERTLERQTFLVTQFGLVVKRSCVSAIRLSFR